MKKIFMTLGTCFMAALMVVSCQDNNKPDNSGKNNQGGQDDVEEEALITIDGQFKDWADAPKVFECYLPDGAEKVSVLALKVTSDENKLYIYFEQELEDGQAMSPFDFFLNTDGKDETGASTYLWEDAGWEYLIESEAGFLASATAVKDMADMALYKFIGPDGADGWDDPDESDDIDAPYQERTEESGFATSAGVVENGIAKVEVAVDRAVFEGMVKKITVGILLYEGESWADNGLLPQGDEGALCPMMAVELQ